jgi:signal transduction histidine kinase
MQQLLDRTEESVVRIGPDGVAAYANAAGRRWLDAYGGGAVPSEVTPLLEGLAYGERAMVRLGASVYALRRYEGADGAVDLYVLDVTREDVVGRFPDRNPNPVLRLSYDGVLRYANAASDRLVAACAIRVGELVPSTLLRSVADAAQTGQPLEVQAGGARVYEVLCVAVEELAAFNLYGTDVTADRELDAARDTVVRSERMAALGRMVVGVAHELNTPLGVILTASTMLEEGQTAVQDAFTRAALGRGQLERFLVESNEAARVITRAVQRAAELVRRFKGVAADQVTEQARVVVLRDHLRDVVGAMAPYTRQERMSVTVDGDDVALRTYPSAFTQIVDNVLVNASVHAYLPDTPVEARRLRFHAVAAPGGGALLTVEDDGVGMDTETLARACEPFFTTRRGRGGTGLGLHIVHNLVVGPLGGQLELSSAPGRGTRLLIRLPAVCPPRPEGQTAG